MLKTGIYHLSQIERDTQLNDFFGVPKKVSITLYEQALSHPRSDELMERILLYFADERGAYKRTYAKRFETFDRKVLKVLTKEFDVKTRLLIHDVAVSDARTSVDFFQKVSRIYSSIYYVASDYDPKICVIEQGKLKVTLSSGGKILEIVWPPFVFNTIKRESYLHYPINHLIRWIVLRLKVQSLMRDFRSGKVKAKEVLLFSPQALKLAKTDRRFRLDKHDLRQSFESRHHIIRAMNILNPDYFSKEDIRKIVKNIHYGLKTNGILIVGSNQGANSRVAGGVYKKTKTGFNKILTTGSFPLEPQLLQFTL